MKTFNIEKQTCTRDEYQFSGSQEDAFVNANCERVFTTKSLMGNALNLPKYILLAIDEAGYTPHHLGGTTYQYSVVGLSKKIPFKKMDIKIGKCFSSHRAEFVAYANFIGHNASLWDENYDTIDGAEIHFPSEQWQALKELKTSWLSQPQSKLNKIIKNILCPLAQ